MGRAIIWINDECGGDDEVATMAHECIHQYQVEVLDMPAEHDAIFKSIARHMEKFYRLKLR